MKKIFGLVLFLLIASFAMATPTTVNDKVLKAFSQLFPKVANPAWYEYETYYEVYFDNNNVKCRIRYDLDGNIMSTRRDYMEPVLSPFIKAKINEKYPDKKIFGVTEITSDEGLSYIIILEDEKHWYHVTSDGTGQIYLQKKLIKG
jgi:hypothetical protein